MSLNQGIGIDCLENKEPVSEIDHFFKPSSNKSCYDRLRKQFGDEKIISCLSHFLTQQRQEKISQVIDARLKYLHLAVECPYDMQNAMAALRTAEGIGISHMHLIKDELKKMRGRQTSGGSWRWTEIHKHQTFSEFYDRVKSQKWQIAGACFKGAMPLEMLPVDVPLILLFGNEKRGLSDEAIKACDYRFQIPMHGMVTSFNLSVSSAISLFITAKRYRTAIGAIGDLSDREKLIQKADYMIRAIGYEKAKLMLVRAFSNNRVSMD